MAFSIHHPPTSNPHPPDWRLPLMSPNPIRARKPATLPKESSIGEWVFYSFFLCRSDAVGKCRLLLELTRDHLLGEKRDVRLPFACHLSCCCHSDASSCRSCVVVYCVKMSDMDSDCDDVFSEGGYGAATDDSKSMSGVDEDGRHVMNRKRRRGIIEKRRRDRINNSLSELRRLVPAAFEKQGSAKLEKAEILQMTVDHLRIMHSKGMDVFNFDPHNFIMDYHGIGFRECASEVARYLVGFEGLDLQDPLRLRLMSHLQCFSAQRDLAISSSQQQSQSPSPWFSALPAIPTPQYPSFASRGSSRDFPMYSSSRSSADRRPSSASSAQSTDTSTSSRGSPRVAPHIPVSPIALNASALLGGFGRASVIVPEGPKQPSPVRPYRPWGTELAY